MNSARTEPLPNLRLKLTALVLLLGACGTGSGGVGNAQRSSPTHTVFFRADMIPVRRVLTAPVETIGAAVPQTFADLGFPSGASARDSAQVYLTPYLRIHGELYKGELNSVYIDCGHAPGGGHAADSYEVTFAMLVRLTPQDGDLVLVEVLIDGTARDRTLNLSNSVYCTGTGRLEREFLQRLEARIKSAPNH